MNPGIFGQPDPDRISDLYPTLTSFEVTIFKIRERKNYKKILKMKEKDRLTDRPIDRFEGECNTIK